MIGNVSSNHSSHDEYFYYGFCAKSQERIDKEELNSIDDVRECGNNHRIIRGHDRKTTILEAIFKRSTLSTSSSAGDDRQCLHDGD